MRLISLQRVSMRFLPLAAVAAAALAGCDSGSGKTEATIENAYVRLPAVPGRPGAGYFRLEATEDLGALTGVTSPRAGRIEMHETMTSGGMASMRPIERVAAGEEIRFEPGGRHLMLFEIDPKVQAGGKIQLSFQFEHGKPVPVEAEVRAAGDDGGH
jgi:copper(I)-binding protein